MQQTELFLITCIRNATTIRHSNGFRLKPVTTGCIINFTTVKRIIKRESIGIK